MLADGWIARVAEVAAIVAVAGFLFSLWWVGQLAVRFKQRVRWGMVWLTMLGGAAGVAAAGVAAGMFFVATHDDGGAPTGWDYGVIWLALFGPVAAAGFALLVWICVLMGAEDKAEERAEG